MKFSIVIPARDEEKLIGRCFDSIERAARPYPGEVEVIVVINRCTDSTEAIARSRGAKIVRDDSRCLARIRNAGAREATGDILITIDADSRMSENMLEAIDRKLGGGRYIGGGVPVRADRASAGIIASSLFLFVAMAMTRLAGGLYWCRRRDFEAVGGFDESRIVGEDLNFAKRLREHGKKSGKKFGTLWGTHILTSARKFDRFGDWFFFRILFSRQFVRVARGRDREFADRYFYDFEH